MPRKRDWETVTAAGPAESPGGPARVPTVASDSKRRSNMIGAEDPSFTRRRGSQDEPGSLFDTYGRGR